jgi:hypothetical protein
MICSIMSKENSVNLIRKPLFYYVNIVFWFLISNYILTINLFFNKEMELE